MILQKIKNFIINIVVVCFSFFIRKQDNIILFGSWMGEKFADNSRYLFQYLDLNKKNLSLKKVIWVTRSKRVYRELIDLGYTCAIIGTYKSFYWHCKAGIHIICNVYEPSKTFRADIDTNLSARAKKIQLWHGNGIKNVPNNTSKMNDKKKIYRFIKLLTSRGGWIRNNYYLLCKADIDVDLFYKKFGVDKKYCIDAAYPRVCRCVKFLIYETELLEKISKYNKVILYLPTFRDNYDNFIYPLSDIGMQRFIKTEHILWIEKPHSAGIVKKDISNNMENVISLDKNFDINTIIPYISVLVTDYSSAMLDALYFKKQIVYFVPDFDYYVNRDRGFLIDYDSICINKKVKEIKNLKNNIIKIMQKKKYDKNADEIRSFFWKHNNWSYYNIWCKIKEI